MRKFIFAIALFSAVLASNTIFAQNQITVVYEDNTNNKDKVEWTRTVEIADAEIGVPKTVKVPVKNISKEPLYILTAKSHCGCTDAAAPKEPIAPGATGYVEITYTAKARTEVDKNGFDKMIPPPFSFYQIVDVTTNFDKENSVVLSVQGTVIK